MRKNIYSEILYMVLDITKTESTKLLKIAPLAESQLWGKLFQAEGLNVIAPPLEGRGFSKLDKLNLQYLFWNTFQETPPEDYNELLSLAHARFQKMPKDTTNIRELEREVEKRCPDITTPKNTGEPTKIKEPKDPNERPKSTSTTGLVWDIADQIFQQYPNEDIKFLRNKIIDACTNEGINSSTAATQYSKWKAAKFPKEKLAQ